MQHVPSLAAVPLDDARELGSVRAGAVLAALALAQLTVILDGSIVTAAMPSVQADFGSGSGAALLTAYTLPFGGLLLLGGRLGDHLGRRRMFIAGLAGLVVASVLAALAPGMTALASARALQGASAALLSPAALALIDATFTTSRDRARAFGVFGAVSGAGSAVGLLLGGLLVEHAGWRWCLVAGVPFAVASAVLAKRVVPESRGSRAGGGVVLAGVLATVGLAVLAYGLTRVAALGVDSPTGWVTGAAAALAPGTVLLAMFVVVERRSSSPLISRALWGSARRRAAWVASGLASAGLTASFPLLALFLTQLGYGPSSVALAFLPCSLTSLASSTLAGALLARVSPVALMLIGTLFGVAGLLSLATADAGSTYATGVLPGLVLTSVSGGLIFTPLPFLILQGVDPDDRGVASAMVTSTQQIGGAIGTTVLLAMASAAGSLPTAATAGGPPVTGATQHPLAVTLSVAAAIVLVAGAFLARLWRTKQQVPVPVPRAGQRHLPRFDERAPETHGHAVSGHGSPRPRSGSRSRRAPQARPAGGGPSRRTSDRPRVRCRPCTGRGRVGFRHQVAAADRGAGDDTGRRGEPRSGTDHRTWWP